MSTEGAFRKDFLHLQSRRAAHAPSVREKSALRSTSAENGTASHLQKLATCSEQCFPSSHPSYEGEQRLQGRWISVAEMDGSTRRSRNGRVGEPSEAYSSKALQASRSPLHYSITEKFSLDQLTSMIIPYSICPLLPNFPFASSPTVFFPDLEAFLSGSEAVPECHLPLATQNEHPDIASAAGDDPFAQPCWEDASFEHLRQKSEGQSQPITTKLPENDHAPNDTRRRGRRSLSDTLEAVAERRKGRPATCLLANTGSGVFPTSGRGENDKGQQRVPSGSNNDECVLPRSASDTMVLDGKASDQLSCSDAGCTNEKEIAPTRGSQRQIGTAEKLCSTETVRTIAGSTTKIMTLAHLKSATAGLSLDRRLLFFILLALPWAVTLAFYIYVPRRIRRQLQWLFPNVLILGAFIVTLAACLQWRFSIIVDLIVLLIQLCSWFLLAFLGSASGGHGGATSVHCAAKCEPDTAVFPADHVDFAHGQADRGGVGANTPVISSKKVFARESEETGSPTASAAASQVYATFVSCAPLSPPKEDLSSQRLNEAVVEGSDMKCEVSALAKNSLSELHLAARVHRPVERTEGKPVEVDAPSHEPVRVNETAPGGPQGRTEEASVIGEMSGLFQLKPTSIATSVETSESHQTENSFSPANTKDCVALLWEAFALREDKNGNSDDEIGQQVSYMGKTVTGEERRSTVPTGVDEKLFPGSTKVGGCQHEVEEDDDQLIQHQQQQTSPLLSWGLATASEMEKIRRVGSRGLITRETEMHILPAHPEPCTAVGQQQELKTCISCAQKHEKNEFFTAVSEKHIRPQPSTLLEEALKGVCRPFQFADIALSGAGSDARISVSSGQCKQRQENKVVAENRIEGGTTTKERQRTRVIAKEETSIIPSDAQFSLKQAIEEDRRADAVVTAGGGTERAPMPASEDAASVVEARCECTSISSSSEFDLSKDVLPLMAHSMMEEEEDNAETPLPTDRLVNDRYLKSERGTCHSPLSVGVPEKHVEMISGVEGERCFKTSISHQGETKQDVCTSFQQETQTTGFSVEDVLRPFLGCSKQKVDADDKGTEKHPEEERNVESTFLVEGEREISVIQRPDTIVASTPTTAIGTEEKLFVGPTGGGQQHNADTDGQLRFWPSFRDVWLQTYHYTETDNTGDRGGSCGARTAASDPFERVETALRDCEAKCDTPFAEMFSYDLASDKYFSQHREEEQQHSTQQQAEGFDWSDIHTRGLQSLMADVDPYMWPSDSFSLGVLPGAAFRGEGREEQHDFFSSPSMQWGTTKERTEAQTVTESLPPLDDSPTPKEISSFHSEDSVVATLASEKEVQEGELSRSEQILLESAQSQQQLAFLTSPPRLKSEMACTSLMTTENERMWNADISLSSLCLLGRKELQSASNRQGTEEKAARPTIEAERVSKSVNVEKSFSSTGRYGVGDISSSTIAVRPSVPVFEEAAQQHHRLCTAAQSVSVPVCETGMLFSTEYQTDTLAAAGAQAAPPPSFALTAEAPMRSMQSILYSNCCAQRALVEDVPSVNRSEIATERSHHMKQKEPTTHTGGGGGCGGGGGGGGGKQRGGEAEKEEKDEEKEERNFEIESSSLFVENSFSRVEGMKEVGARSRGGGQPVLGGTQSGLSCSSSSSRGNVLGRVTGSVCCTYSSQSPIEAHAAGVREPHSKEVFRVVEEEEEKKKLPKKRLSCIITEPPHSLLGSVGASIESRSHPTRYQHTTTKSGGSSSKDILVEKNANNGGARLLMQHYMALVKECYRSRDSHGALQVLELLHKENKIQPDTQLLNYILLVCVAAGPKDLAERLFNLMEESGCADLVTYNTILKSCVEAEDLPAAEKLLQRMKRNSRISPDGVTFNLMVNACVVCRRPDKAWEYIDQIKAAKLTPDKFTISSIIKGLQPGQNRQHISRALKLMEGVNVCEDLLLLSTCLDACARLGEYTHIQFLLKSFEKSTLRLNSHAYGTLIKAYGRLGEMQRVWTLWQQQLKDNIAPTSYTYGCMLDCLATNNQVKAALKMFQEMIDAGVADAMHFSVLIKGLSKHRGEGARWAILAYKMLKVFGTKQETVSSDLHSSSSTSSSSYGGEAGIKVNHNTLIKMISCKGRNPTSGFSSEEGIEGHMKMKQPSSEIQTADIQISIGKECISRRSSSFSPEESPVSADGIIISSRSSRHMKCYVQALNTISYNALLHLCVSTGFLREALQIFEDMQRHPRAAPDLGLEMALQLFHDMQQRARIKADAIIYNTLIQGAATRKRVHLVEVLLQHMIDHGVPPSSYTLCQCIKLHGKCYNLARVLELHRELPSRFLFEVDEYVHTALVAACCQNGAPLLAARFALAACAAQQQLPTNTLKKLLLDLQQRGAEDTERGEIDYNNTQEHTTPTTVARVISELQKILSRREAEEIQQRQQRHQPQQRPQTQQQQEQHHQQQQQRQQQQRQQHQQQHSAQQQQQQQSTQQQQQQAAQQPERQQHQYHQPKQHQHDFFDGRRQRGGMYQATSVIAADAEYREIAACKRSSCCTYSTVSDVSTRGSGASVLFRQEQQVVRQQHRQPLSLIYKRQQEQYTAVQRPHLEDQQSLQLQQSPHDQQRPQRIEGGKHQSHSKNAKRVVTRSHRNNRNKVFHQQQVQTKRKDIEESEGTVISQSTSVSASEMKYKAAREPTVAVFPYRGQTIAPATLAPTDHSTGNGHSKRIIVVEQKTSTRRKDDDGQCLDGSSVVVASKRKNLLSANTAPETIIQTQHVYQATSQKLTRRGRRYCYKAKSEIF